MRPVRKLYAFFECDRTRTMHIRKSVKSCNSSNNHCNRSVTFYEERRHDSYRRSILLIRLRNHVRKVINLIIWSLILFVIYIARACFIVIDDIQSIHNTHATNLHNFWCYYTVIRINEFIQHWRIFLYNSYPAIAKPCMKKVG